MELAKFNSRETYFNKLGTEIKGCQKTAIALELSELNYKVEKRPLFLEDGTKLKDKVATVRTDNNQILGVVGDGYEVLDNEEGFAFIDDIIGEGGADFETAGSFGKGKKAFMIAKTEPLTILGDKFDPYILFTNSHDGSGSIKVMFTPIRVICQNTLVVALKEAAFKISIKHTKSVKERLMAAKEILLANTKYLANLKKNAELMAATKLSKEEFIKVAKEVVDVEGETTELKEKRTEELLSELSQRYEAPDLQNMEENVWRAVQTVSDYESHRDPIRDTKNPEINLQRVMVGMVLLNKFIETISKKKGLRLY